MLSLFDLVNNISIHILVQFGTVYCFLSPLLSLQKRNTEALPGVLGIRGEGLFIFRDLGRRVIYFQGFGEKAGF